MLKALASEGRRTKKTIEARDFMPRSRQYYTLIGSLPALPPDFEDAERVPINRVRLDERLRLLVSEDAEVIEQLSSFLAWDRQPLDRTDEEVCRRYEVLKSQIRNRFIADLMEFAVTLRTIVSALRRRRLDLGPPPGVGPVAAHIKRFWKQPDFRLGPQFPWITEVDAQLNGDSPFGLERMLLRIRWNGARQLSERHHFSFEAVILYLVRWEIVDRWTRRDAVLGGEKFEQLVTEAMGEYADIFKQ